MVLQHCSSTGRPVRTISIESHNFQPLCHGLLVCHERFSSVPQMSCKAIVGGEPLAGSVQCLVLSQKPMECLDNCSAFSVCRRMRKAEVLPRPSRWPPEQ